MLEGGGAYAMPGKPFHISAIMLTITPPCCFIHAVYTVWHEQWHSHSKSLNTLNTEPELTVCSLPSLQQWKVPVRLVSITAFQPLEDISSAGLLNWPPPLFTRKSILPNCLSTDDTRAFTCQTGSRNNIVKLTFPIQSIPFQNPMQRKVCVCVHLILVADVAWQRSDTRRAGRRDFLSHLLSCCLQPLCLSTGDHHTAAWRQSHHAKLWSCSLWLL